jgi:3-deoxy-manno-octulosonate cytidylyltransferase (CMP-KDO synthetase)
MGKIFGVIPAHLESERLPRKLLRPLAGRPMICWVYERCRPASSLDALLVATDSPEILEVCRRHNIPAAMTSTEHRSGTDRISEVAERGLMPGAAGGPGDVYVNIQGDEPMITPRHIDLLLQPFASPDTQVSTLKVAMSSEEALNPGDVKVVTDLAGRALYFSRAPVPHDRGGGGRARYYKHLGLYAYTRTALEKFHALPASELELTERLEQLRFLENGIPVRVVETSEDTIGVDTEDDLRKVEEFFRRLRP